MQQKQDAAAKLRKENRDEDTRRRRQLREGKLRVQRQTRERLLRERDANSGQFPQSCISDPRKCFGARVKDEDVVENYYRIREAYGANEIHASQYEGLMKKFCGRITEDKCFTTHTREDGTTEKFPSFQGGVSESIENACRSSWHPVKWKLKDFYDVLEVDKKSSDKTIKEQYRKLVLERHPDKRGSGDTADISEAWHVLQQRKKYDDLVDRFHDCAEPRFPESKKCFAREAKPGDKSFVVVDESFPGETIVRVRAFRKGEEDEETVAKGYAEKVWAKRLELETMSVSAQNEARRKRAVAYEKAVSDEEKRIILQQRRDATEEEIKKFKRALDGHDQGEMTEQDFEEFIFQAMKKHFCHGDHCDRHLQASRKRLERDFKLNKDEDRATLTLQELFDGAEEPPVVQDGLFMLKVKASACAELEEGKAYKKLNLQKFKYPPELDHESFMVQECGNYGFKAVDSGVTHR